jgi:hypothetical protein
MYIHVPVRQSHLPAPDRHIYVCMHIYIYIYILYIYICIFMCLCARAIFLHQTGASYILPYFCVCMCVVCVCVVCVCSVCM